MNDLISKQVLLYALDDIELIDEGDVDINELEDLIKRMPTIDAEQPKNVFVFRSDIFYKRDDIEVIRNIIKRQVKEGVVVLPRYLTLKAVTGPCTDVEVIIKRDENEE